nr:MAG TPA: hypothetical protein [Caudoviricetes sp.]
MAIRRNVQMISNELNIFTRRGFWTQRGVYR